MSDLIEISGIEIDASILRGRNLVAKDRNAFRKKTSSDPYAQLYINGKSHGQTKVIYKTLDPAWNESFKVMLNASDSNRVFLDFKNGKELEYEIRLFDKDEYSNDDSMGMVKGSISLAKPPTRKWMEVVTAPGHSKAVSGEIEVDISVSVRKMITAIRGNSLDLNGGLIDVMLDWKLESGSVDLDTSCVAVDPNGKILMDETVYFGDLVNSNGSIRHSGDVRSGGSKGEKITCHLSTIKPHVKALYFILTVATPEKSFLDVTSALVSVLDKTNQNVLCKFNPSLVGDHTAMFLMRISRKNNGYGWEMTMIEDTDHTARDFGTLIPEIKGYCRDFARGIVIDPRERIAIMRKGGAVRLRDYAAPNQPVPQKVTFGLAWDVTNGVKIDLDASAICLNSSLDVVDVISFKKLKSDDGAILHGGDEREGDEIGDDEKMYLYLSRMNPSIAHVGFVINSYSGQELDDVSKASCHLFDSNSKVDIASYTLSNNHELDKRTGLILASLYRDDTETWCMRIIAEPGHGKVAKDLVSNLQTHLRNNPTPIVQEVPEPEIIVNEMPEDVEIEVSPIMPSHEVADNIRIPSLGVFVPKY